MGSWPQILIDGTCVPVKELRGRKGHLNPWVVAHVLYTKYCQLNKINFWHFLPTKCLFQLDTRMLYMVYKL